jgi:hypothetical protein
MYRVDTRHAMQQQQEQQQKQFRIKSNDTQQTTESQNKVQHIVNKSLSQEQKQQQQQQQQEQQQKQFRIKNNANTNQSLFASTSTHEHKLGERNREEMVRSAKKESVLKQHQDENMKQKIMQQQNSAEKFKESYLNNKV